MMMMEMSSELSELKTKIFALLREDEESRYAVAGMLGLEEILLDRIKLLMELNTLRYPSSQ
jgi:hypothetical protein